MRDVLVPGLKLADLDTFFDVEELEMGQFRQSYDAVHGVVLGLRAQGASEDFIRGFLVRHHWDAIAGEGYDLLRKAQAIIMRLALENTR